MRNRAVQITAQRLQSGKRENRVSTNLSCQIRLLSQYLIGSHLRKLELVYGVRNVAMQITAQCPATSPSADIAKAELSDPSAVSTIHCSTQSGRKFAMGSLNTLQLLMLQPPMIISMGLSAGKLLSAAKSMLQLGARNNVMVLEPCSSSVHTPYTSQLIHVRECRR